MFFEHNPPPPPETKPKKISYKEQQKQALVVFKQEWEELCKTTALPSPASDTPQLWLWLLCNHFLL